jgi:hypothetical protein
VIYWESDNLKQFDLNLSEPRPLPPSQVSPKKKIMTSIIRMTGNRSCKTVQIALADDHLMFNKYGSVGDVKYHNLAVINDVSTNYDFEFNDDLEFTIMNHLRGHYSG